MDEPIENIELTEEEIFQIRVDPRSGLSKKNF